MIFGGSVVTENPNGGIAKNFGRIQREDHSNLLANEDMGGGGGGISKVINCCYFSEVTFKRGIGKISPCSAQNPTP